MSNLDVLSVTQAAEQLGVSPSTILRRIRIGDLPATKLGTGTSAYLIRREDVDAVLASADDGAA